MQIKGFEIKDRYDVNDALAIIKLLRDPVDGCAWDKEQTHESIRKNFIEETYEACDAIDKKDSELLCEELGDVLLQVGLHAEIERQSGGFDINDVTDRLCKKLILRHPHIFGDVKVDSSAQVLANWDVIKRAEKSQNTAKKAIDDVPAALPALARLQKVSKRAGDFGFDYADARQAMRDLESEVSEVNRALDGDGDLSEEIGDLIFACVNVARKSGIDAEQAAEMACKKFIKRFNGVEAAALREGVDIRTCGMDRLNELWAAVKTEKEV